MGNVYIGKYISKIKTNFSITTDYNYYQSSQIQQHVQYPFNSNTVAVNQIKHENLRCSYSCLSV